MTTRTSVRTGARTGALDKALADRRQLERNAKLAQKRRSLAMYADPVWGKELWDFVSTLNHFGADDADRMVAYVTEQQRKWLHQAPYEFRCAALSACSERQQRIRARAGLPVLSDPLPGEPDDVFRKCKRIIGL